jgi:hypothetical protein
MTTIVTNTPIVVTAGETAVAAAVTPTPLTVQVDQGISVATQAALDGKLNATVVTSGTWTPTFITIGTDMASVTYGAATGGNWTRIGDLVIATGAVVVTAVDTTGAAGALAIGGLPYSAAAASSGTVGFQAGFTTKTPVRLYPQGSGHAYAPVVGIDLNAAQTLLTAANISAASQLTFSMFYVTGDA